MKPFQFVSRLHSLSQCNSRFVTSDDRLREQLPAGAFVSKSKKNGEDRSAKMLHGTTMTIVKFEDMRAESI